ncbi:polysaccharide deacetylase family protein [Streptomyces iakyrus]|uniref:polysaccharide deacetylase family protein n=1 Tax=Streptomyces iakyrus TaxID=68219 RepID=UPI0036B7D044
MPFPPGVQTVTLTAGAAGYRALDGDVYQGTIRLTPSVSRVVSATHGVIALGSENITLGASGEFSKTLLAIDAAGFTPSGWTYRVDEEFTNAPSRSYNISLPASAGTVALSSLTPVETAAGVEIGAEAAGTAAAAVAAHNADTTDVHGIVDTAVLETQAGAASKVTAHAAAADPHGDRAWADGKFATALDLTALGGTVNNLSTTVTAIDGFLNDCLNRVTAIEQGTAFLAGLNVTGAAQIASGTVPGNWSVSGRLTTAGVTLPVVTPSQNRPAYRAASWSQQFQSGHGWTASGSGVGSSNVNDTTTFCRGTQSFRVTTTGTGAVANIRRLASALPDLTGKAIRLIFRVSDVTHLNQINVIIGTSTVANTFNWRLHTHASAAENQVLSGEWVTMTLSWSDVRSVTGTYTISSTGVPSVTSGFTDFMFQVVDDNTGNPITVNLQAVEIIPDTKTTFSSGVLSITFDDSYASQHTLARPKMDSLGYRGTLYTICENIGTSQYLTEQQLRSMQDQSGWEIAGHAYYSANHNTKYNALSAAVVEDDIRRTRAWMIDRGFPGDSFAYPGGWFSHTTDGTSIEALTCKYFSNGRGISSADNLETFPPAAPFRARSITGIGSLAGASAKGLPANLTGAGGALDRCLQGQWTILTFHEIVSGTAATTNQCSQTDFNAIMDAINSRGILVLPVGDVLRLYQ